MVSNVAVLCISYAEVYAAFDTFQANVTLANFAALLGFAVCREVPNVVKTDRTC